MSGSSVMIAVAWVLMSGVAWCLATPLAPVPSALEAPTATHNTAGSDVSEVPQEKRLLKYLLPSSASWVPTQQEGSKRGYSRNYLRFGRSEEDKRDGRNFLRFGRGGDSVDDSDFFSDAEDSVEKRNRNFLRFGRDRNFLRFGRSNGLAGGPLAFVNSVHDDDLVEDYPLEEKRNGHRNFMGFAREGNRNFLRFGRSVDRQLNEQKARDTPISPTAAPNSPAKAQESHRAKRAAGSYDYMVLPSHGPLAWVRDYQPDQEDEDLEESLDAPEVAKRVYNKSFLRFGRDRNFLRFGKRSDDTTPSDVVVMKPVLRVPQSNFLRFG